MYDSDDYNDSDHVGEVFITGAFCVPCRWVDPETGRIQWYWAVCCIEDDSFRNGKNVNVQETADTRAGLIVPWPWDED